MFNCWGVAGVPWFELFWVHEEGNLGGIIPTGIIGCLVNSNRNGPHQKGAASLNMLGTNYVEQEKSKMKKFPIHNITPKVAREQQVELAKMVDTSGSPKNIKIIAGVDIAYSKKPSTGFCAISLFSYPDLKHIKTYYELELVGYPYIPGLLSYREGPLILQTLEKVEEEIDLFIFDGQGIAHPKSLGIASHLGVLLDKPAIGCAKSRLIGEYEEPGEAKGSKSDLVNENGDVIGTVLRTRDDTNPVFVSPGHKIGVKEASDIILNCATEYRLPEPIRKADQEAEKYKNEGDI